MFVAIALMSSIVSTATPSAGGGYYEAFIDVNSELKDYMLEAAGVVITAKYDGFYTVQIRDDVSIQTVKAIPGVDHVSKALTLLTCSDSVRYFSRVGNVHSGATLPQAYTGQGVIVGVIDCGFDFNHINLCDENGNTRVKAVYMPLDKTGSQPVVNHRLLPGSCYETPSQIMSLTTDDRNTTHGTQTAGIAAGSYRGNGWYGIAPDADLVLCGMPEGDLTDVRVANCISYINDYASRMGKPCVINISLGSNVGAHDGSSYLCRVFNQYSGPGRVFVVSAGNDGSEPVCVHSSIKSKEDTVVTLLRGYGGGNEYSGYVNAWSNKDKPFNTRFIVANSRTGAILYRSRALGATLSGVYDVFTTDDDPDLAKYCVGSVTVQGVIEFNGRPSSLCELNMRTRSSNYVLGIQYYSPLTTEVFLGRLKVPLTAPSTIWRLAIALSRSALITLGRLFRCVMVLSTSVQGVLLLKFHIILPMALTRTVLTVLMFVPPVVLSFLQPIVLTPKRPTWLIGRLRHLSTERSILIVLTWARRCRLL